MSKRKSKLPFPTTESQGAVKSSQNPVISPLTNHFLTAAGYQEPTNIQRSEENEAEADRVAETVVSRKPVNNTPPSGEKQPAFASGLSRGGNPMNGPLRDEMEQGFGRQLDHVRLHTDSNADQLSRSINARAFAHGDNVYFKQGQYDPGSKEGKKLIAHEIQHTLQPQAKSALQRQEDPKGKGAISGAARAGMGSMMGKNFLSGASKVGQKAKPLMPPPGKLHKYGQMGLGRIQSKGAVVYTEAGVGDSNSNPAAFRAGADTEIAIAGIHGNWYLIRANTPGNPFGYVHKNSVRIVIPPKEEEMSLEELRILLEVGDQYYDELLYNEQMMIPEARVKVFKADYATKSATRFQSAEFEFEEQEHKQMPVDKVVDMQLYYERLGLTDSEQKNYTEEHTRKYIDFSTFIARIKKEEQRYPEKDRTNLPLMITRFRKIFYGTEGWNDYLIKGTGDVDVKYKSEEYTDHKEKIKFGDVTHRLVKKVKLTDTETGKTSDWLQNQEVELPNGNIVDIGHVFAGLDAHNHPNKVKHWSGLGPTVDDNKAAATWVGDMASIVAESVFRYMHDRAIGDPRNVTWETVQYELDLMAPPRDMLGNMDAYLIPEVIDVKSTGEMTVSQMLETFYLTNHKMKEKPFTNFARLIGLGHLETGTSTNPSVEVDWVNYQSEQVSNAATQYFLIHLDSTVTKTAEALTNRLSYNDFFIYLSERLCVELINYLSGKVIDERG